MSVLHSLTGYIANTTSHLTPLTLPIAPIEPVSTFIQHITSTNVHETYFPFVRFGAIHAIRVSLIWAGMTKGRKERDVSVLQDLFGYLVLAWGGGTITSLLLSQPPSWLISSTPWSIYIPIYFLSIRTGLSQYMMSTAPTLINLFGAYIDGVTRGTTITALPKSLSVSPTSSSSSSSSLSPAALGDNLWATALLSGIAVSSGGWVIQLLGLNEDSWKIGKPVILNGGLLDTLDLWSGIVIGIIYAALTGRFKELDGVRRFCKLILPEEIGITGGGSVEAKKGDKGGAGRVGAATEGIVDPNTARAICVILLGSLLAARVITRLILDGRSRRVVDRQTKVEFEEELEREKMVEAKVIKAPVEVEKGKTKVEKRKKQTVK